MLQDRSILEILIIEDNPGDVTLVEEYLAQGNENYNLTHVELYKTADKLLADRDFDVILLDLTLPDLSGEELVESVIKVAAGTPVVVLTGYENQDFGLKTLQIGAADYVLKDELSGFLLEKVISYSIERNRTFQKIKNSESRYRDLFDLSPMPKWVYDKQTLKILNVNKAAVDKYGYEKDEFLNMSVTDIIAGESSNRNEFCDGRFTHKTKNGTVLTVQSISQPIEFQGQKAIMAVLEDISEKLEAEEQLLQKSRLLAANAKVAGALIQTDNWIEVLDQTFSVIGEAVDVDRVYYFKSHSDPDTGDMLFSQRLEWVVDRVEPQIDNPYLQNIKQEDYPLFFDPILKGNPFIAHIDELPEGNEKEVLGAQDIQSILILPIYVNREFQGFIGLDDCRNKRNWNPEELSYLKSIASNIANAIQLRNTNEQLRLNEYKFKTMVQENSDIIAVLNKDGAFKYVSPNIEQVLGWGPDELLNSSAFDHIHPDDIEGIQEIFAQLFSGKETKTEIYRYRHSDGSWRWMRARGNNLLDDPVINGVLLTIQDITQSTYFSRLQKLERDVLEENAINQKPIKEITEQFIEGIEKLHTHLRATVTLMEDGRLYRFAKGSMPNDYLTEINGLEVGEGIGSCGTAAFRKERVIVNNIFNDPLWEGYRHLGEKYNFSACWSQPLLNNKGDVIGTFAVYYKDVRKPSEFDMNTIERGAHILRILFETKQKEVAEQKLAESENRFRTMIQEGGDLIAILDQDGNYTYASPNTTEVMGVDSDEFQGRNVFEFIHENDRERITNLLTNLKPGERQRTEPFRFQFESGRVFWFESTVANMMDNPVINGYLANTTDVTERIKRDEKLRELSLVASKTTDVVIITDAEKRVTWVNEAFVKLTGYTFEDIKGKNPGKILQGPETDPTVVERISKAMVEAESVEETILNYRKDGTPYWLELNIDPIFDENGNCTHFIAIERDVTDKIEREIQLKESLERYEIVAKATSDTIWDMDLATGMVEYNNNIYSMFGYDKDHVYPAFDWWKENLHPEDRPVVNQKLREVLASGTERFQMEYRFRDSDGNYKYVFDRAFVLNDENGEPVRMIGAMQDITQETLEQQELELRESVITNTNDTVVITEAEPSGGRNWRKIIYVNEAFVRITGYSKDEVLGESIEILNGPETDQNEIQKIRDSVEAMESSEAEILNYTKDGQTFWNNFSLVPVKDRHDNYTHWVIIGRDVSDYKQKEKELRESIKEKETLLAEIHHRVKNNLAIVSSLMQMQAMNSDSDVLNRQLLESVLRIKSMAGIHEQLYQAQNFSKLQFSDSLKSLSENIVDTLQTGTKVELQLELEAIELNINQSVPCSLLINEVITNILKHGFKGKDKGTIQIQTIEENDLITIRIVDNGVGLPDDFDERKHTSLGLELIDLLTKQLEGENGYQSNGDGTSFELKFKKADIKGSASALVN